MVLDLGAGTGQLTVAVAPACARVVAVDVSPVMLRSLRSRVSSPGLANVEVVQAGFLTDRASAPVDVAYSRCARHHLPDFWKSLALSAQQSAQRRRSAASPRSRPTGGLRLRNPPSVSAGLANATAQPVGAGPAAARHCGPRLAAGHSSGVSAKRYPNAAPRWPRSTSPTRRRPNTVHGCSPSRWPPAPG